MGLRYEAWTLPSTGTFQRVIADLPVVEGTGSGSVRMNVSTEGRMSVPNSYDRLDDIISDTAGSLIRVYDGSTLIHEWMAERVDRDLESDLVIISGPDLKAAFDRTVVYPYDYPKNPSLQQDWSWGGGQNLVGNPGFETVPLQNGGFEDGNDDYWQLTTDDGFLTDATSITAVNSSGDARSGNWYGLVNPGNASNTGAKRTISGLTVGETYTIIGWLLDPSASGDSWVAGVSGASTATHTNAYSSDDYWWAELGNAASGTGASNGSWQGFNLTFVAAAESVQLVVIYNDSNAPPNFRLDDWTITGAGAGLYPWYPSLPTQTDTFKYQTSVVNSGSGALEIQGNDLINVTPYGYSAYGRFGVQQDIRLRVGQTYTASIWVRQNSGSDQYFIFGLERVASLGAFGSPGSARIADTRVAVSSGAWTQIQITGVADVEEARLILRWQYQGAKDTSAHASPTFYVDDATVTEGLPETTVGDIVTLLMDDATSDHSSDTRGAVLDWVDYSGFDATNDSSSDTWDDTLAFIAYRGMTYGQVFDALVDLGYEWRLVAKASPGATTHDLEWYNDGNMDDAPTVGITVGQNTPTTSVIKRIPKYTAVLVEGNDGVYVEDKDATAETNFGRFETYEGSNQWANSATLTAAGDHLLSQESTNRTAIQAEVIAGDHARPLVDYTVGDTISFQFPPSVAKTNRRVSQVAYRNTQPATYQVTGSRIFAGESKAYEALRILLRKFNKLDRPAQLAGFGSGDGVGSIPTVLVAASDAPERIQKVADFICDGTDDHVEIQFAADLIHAASSNAGGRIVLSSGGFSAQYGEIDLGEDIHLMGMGTDTTITFSGGSGDGITTGSDCIISDLTLEAGVDV